MLASKYSGWHKEVISIKTAKIKQCTMNTTSFVFKKKVFQIYLTSAKKQFYPGLNTLCSLCFFCSHSFLLTSMPQWETGQW